MLGALWAGDLPGLVRVVGALLRLLALDVDSRHHRGIPIPFYILAGTAIVLYTYTYHVSGYWFISTRGRSDVLFCIILFSIAINSLIGVVKLLLMYINRKKWRELVSEYLECDAALAGHGRMARRVRAELLRVRRRAAVLWLVIIGNGVVYVLQPLLTPGRHLMDDKQILLGLEPMFESPNYEIAYLIESITAFFSVYTAGTITAFVIIIVGYTEAQMLALSEELLHLWEDAQSHYQQSAEEFEAASVVATSAGSTQYNRLDYAPVTNMRARESRLRDRVTEKGTVINAYAKHRLISIIKLHAININLIKKVDSIVQSSIAFEFILLSVALIAVLLGGLENTYVEVPFALSLVSMDCITGQKLMDANRAFEEAAYGCGWEQLDAANRRLVLLLLQNAQRTMTLSAGGVARLSYASLMTVVRSIYSAYTALRSTMNQ